jgi:hypothetical protein
MQRVKEGVVKKIGQVITHTFGVIKERFCYLLGVYGVFFAVQLGLMAVLGIGIGASVMGGLARGDASAFGVGMIATIIVVYLAYFLIFFAQFAAMSAAASPLQRVSFGDAVNAGLRSAPTLFGVFILFMIGYLAFALAFGIVAGLLSMAGSAGTAIATVLVFIAAVYLMCRISLVNSIAAVDRIGNPITVLARSWAITRGKVLPIVAIMLIFGLAAMLLMGVLFAPFYASLTASMTSGQAPNFGSLGVFFVGTLVATLATVIVFSALLAVIHSEISGSSHEEMSEVFA